MFATCEFVNGVLSWTQGEPVRYGGIIRPLRMMVTPTIVSNFRGSRSAATLATTPADLALDWHIFNESELALFSGRMR